jgi:predicted aspartyl protease
MGIFTVPVQIGNQATAEFVPVDALVDTGATALELFGLVADPANQRLITVPALLKISVNRISFS